MSTDMVYDTVNGVRLLWDTVHDEVYLEGSGLVVMVNDRWVVPYECVRFYCLCVSMEINGGF